MSKKSVTITTFYYVPFIMPRKFETRSFNSLLQQGPGVTALRSQPLLQRSWIIHVTQRESPVWKATTDRTRHHLFAFVCVALIVKQ